MPGAASSAPAVPTTLIPSTTVGGNKPSTTLSGGTSTGSAGVGPGTTLQSGYYWVRAVSSPNFHQYIQSNPLYTASKAVLGSYLTAGQFQIVDGQLEQLLTTGNYLYAIAEQNTTTATKLGVSFSTTKNTFGTWKWNGDDLQWSTPGITRPNLSAMLVCENNDLYLNLGAYAYMTPAGCVDQTVCMPCCVMKLG